MSPIYTKDPAAVRDVRKDTRFNASGVGGNTNAHVITALSDASDSTYCKTDAAALPVDLSTGYVTPGAGERIVSVVPFIRSGQDGAKKPTFTVGAYVPATHAIGFDGLPVGERFPRIFEAVTLTIPPGATITTRQIDPRNGALLNPNGAAEWEEFDLFSLTFRDPHTDLANRAEVYKCGVYAYALKAATIAAPTAPASPVTTTQYPTITANVSAVVESWQVTAGLAKFLTGVTVEFTVYAGTYTTPPAAAPLAKWTERFDCSTYGDGVTPTVVSCSSSCPAALPNGAITAFVRVSRDHPSGVPAWSSYQYRQWTQSLTLPTAPTLTLGVSDANQRNSIVVTAAATAGYESATGQAQIQRLVGGVWREVRGSTDAAIAIGASTVFYDYESARGATNTYRARVSMWHTADAVRRYSAWTQQTVAGPALTGWNLKTVEAPGGNILRAPILTKPAESSQAPSATLEPLGRDRPIVLLGTLGGFSGAYEFVADGAAAIAAFEALEKYRGIVYLEDAFGAGRWIALTGVSWTKEGVPAAPRRRGALEYVEISHGLEEELS